MSRDACVLFRNVQIDIRVNLEKEQNMTEKDAHVQKLHAKLDEWNAEIDKLKIQIMEGKKWESKLAVYWG
jgi:hypothetical protein